MVLRTYIDFWGELARLDMVILMCVHMTYPSLRFLRSEDSFGKIPMVFQTAMWEQFSCFDWTGIPGFTDHTFWGGMGTWLQPGDFFKIFSFSLAAEIFMIPNEELQSTDEYCLPKKPLNTKYTFQTGYRKLSACKQSHHFLVNKFVLL